MANARCKRLQKLYGITEAEYGKLLQAGRGGCWVCHKPPVTRALNVDHDHDVVKDKVYSARDLSSGKWTAWSGELQSQKHRLKRDAVAEVKRLLRRKSVRGLLCGGRYAGCNRRLGRIDNPQWLRESAQYLEEYQQGRGAQEILNG